MRHGLRASNQEALAMDMSNPPVAPRAPRKAALFDRAPDPEPGWATRNPDRALAFLFVSPRPCAALEELMSL